jgi:hypothetical protein
MASTPSSSSSGTLLTISSGKGNKEFLTNPESFVRELNRPSVTVDVIRSHRDRVQAEADDINIALKKNVYKNYPLFIDSSKMISMLKDEMVSLSRMLNDQQTLMSSLTEISISGDRTHGLTLNEKKEVAAKFKMNENASSNTMISSTTSTGTSSTIMTLSGTSDSILGTPSKTMTRSYTSGTGSSLSVNNAAAIELNQVMDKIEGCSGIIETRNRYLLNHGELTELDANDYSMRVPNQGRTLAVLLNDCLILALAYPFPSRSGKKYKFVSLFELDNIAVINVKDANFKSAFKILMFPQTKVFDAETPEAKKKWLDSFDAAKKSRRQSMSLQRRDSLLFGSIDSVPSTMTSSVGAGVPSKGLLSPDRNVYSFDEEMEDNSESESEVIPQWLHEFPDDMDVFIAQRNFEDAVSLVLKVNDHLVLYPKCYDGFFQNDLKLRVNDKIQELVECIANELQSSPDRSLQSGPRSSRRAVQLLLKLNKSSLATKLFLSQRSSILRWSLKQQISEGSPIVFIKRLTSVFFNNIIETSREFEKAFKTSSSLPQGVSSSVNAAGHSSLESGANSQPNSLNTDRDSMMTLMNGNESRTSTSSFPPSYPMSCLLIWCQKEVTDFVNRFSKHVFLPNVPLTTACESVSILRNQANRLRNAIGLDLLFYLDKLLKEEIDKTIKESKDKLLETMKTKFGEETWQAQNLNSLPAVEKFFSEVKEPTLRAILKQYIYDEVKLSLAMSIAFFAKSYVTLITDWMKMSTPFTHRLIFTSLLDIIRPVVDFHESSLTCDKFRKDSKFIRRNATFLLDQVIPIIDAIYKEKTGGNFKELNCVRIDYEHLKGESRNLVSDDKKGNNGNNSRRSSHSNGSSSTTIGNNTSSEKKRPPSKSTVSISDGKIVSTTTYL